MDSRFHYACTVYGHEADVRDIFASPLPSTQIISASRDKTARLWAEDDDGSGYHQKHSFEGHTNFASSVTAIGPSEDYPEGLIFTGSSDKIIRMYSPLSSQPIAELKGHTDTVCALGIGEFQMLVSGSWDKTARVWIYKKGVAGVEGKQVLKLEGHTAAVWAVLLLQQGLLATGSADKTVKLWKAGKCVHTFSGHEDCVRALAALSACQFLSCSNDATVRRWTTTGECLHVYYGHTNYVYSISVLAGGAGFVSCGEDRTLKVWKLDSSEPAQDIALPAQSAWSAAVLENGDIAVALSDSTMRIFTTNSDRTASAANVAAYEAEVIANLAKSGEGQKINEKDLQPISALESPGAKDGQVIMVRDGTAIQAHQWSESAAKWTNLGDVVGANDKKAAGGKTEYQGVEYDYVFDVDIQEGAPALKLPYNLSEDPWFAAQKFIDDNDLSQYFLEEICTFIMDNTKDARKNHQPAVADGNTADDPFTGKGRYVPGTDDNSSAATSAEDPFTGGGRYVPGSGDNEIHLGGGVASDPIMNPNRYIPSDTDAMDTAPPAKPQSVLRPPSTSYFPKEGYITFAVVNAAGIQGKLTTFSEQCGGLTESEMSSLKEMLRADGSVTPSAIETLWKILQWPADCLLPALDVLRLTCLWHEFSCKQLCCGTTESDDRPKKLVEMLCRHIVTNDNSKAANANRLLSLRALCNMFAHAEGSAFLMASYKDVLPALSEGFNLGLSENNAQSAPYYGNKNVQIAAASLLLNYSVLLSASSEVKLNSLIRELSSAVRSSCVEVVIVHLVTGESMSDSEATFRYLVCLGTLISDDSNDTWVKRARALGAGRVAETAGAVYSNVPKIFECTKSLSVMLFE